MKTDSTSPKIAGALFLLAMVSSLVGGGIIESVIGAADYLISIASSATQLFIGSSFEMINAIAIIAISVILFPILKQHNEQLAIGYVSFRIIESIFCIISAIVPLLLLALNQQYLASKEFLGEPAYFNSLATLIINARMQCTGLLIPLFFSSGALLFYYMLYASRLVPRFISIWGIIGVILILILNFLINDTHSLAMALALPIILNEIFLGFWMIIKGFSYSAGMKNITEH